MARHDGMGREDLKRKESRDGTGERKNNGDGKGERESGWKKRDL